MSSGVTAQGARVLITKAAGTRMTLLRADPLATAHTTGNSRLALTPATCWALSAKSSASTPEVFRAATLVSNATSSSPVAMSSSRANRLDGMVALDDYARGVPRRGGATSECEPYRSGGMPRDGGQTVAVIDQPAVIVRGIVTVCRGSSDTRQRPRYLNRSA